MTQAFNLSQFANKVNTSGQASLTTAVTGTLPVANGGSGQTTYIDGQLLIGNTTGNTLTKATITAGTGISVTNGSGAITIASTASGGFTNMQVFTSPGTFTTPASTTKLKVTVVGGGGSGGAGASAANTGGGGGGAAIYVGPVSASTPYAVTAGAGGTGASSSSGNAGGTSSFGSLASATGGTGGTNTPTSGPAGITTPGGAGSAGTLLLTGGNSYIPPANTGARTGGNSLLSSVNQSLNTTPSPSVGIAYGGGSPGSLTPASQAGAVGIVIVEY